MQKFQVGEKEKKNGNNFNKDIFYIDLILLLVFL